MCKIIQFPESKIQNIESNVYFNLKRLFEICESLKTCDFYLGTVEVSFKEGRITENEMLTLRRIGRMKRLELSKLEKKEAEKADKPGTYIYTPEMGEQKPECQIEATLGHYGTHYYISTPLELKGRGIKENPVTWVDGCRKKIENWKSYKVTLKAFEKLKSQYSISMECLL